MYAPLELLSFSSLFCSSNVFDQKYSKNSKICEMFLQFKITVFFLNIY